MRKGADCLSKWVGEAERQLRLLFEEAKAAQPSIIFFDEIDGGYRYIFRLQNGADRRSRLGLAPVRSSKQDQVHSSLVATLLALMDGMDGRGEADRSKCAAGCLTKHTIVSHQAKSSSSAQQTVPTPSIQLCGDLVVSIESFTSPFPTRKRGGRSSALTRKSGNPLLSLRSWTSWLV